MNLPIILRPYIYIYFIALHFILRKVPMILLNKHLFDEPQVFASYFKYLF